MESWPILLDRTQVTKPQVESWPTPLDRTNTSNHEKPAHNSWRERCQSDGKHNQLKTVNNEHITPETPMLQREPLVTVKLSVFIKLSVKREHSSTPNPATQNVLSIVMLWNGSAEELGQNSGFVLGGPVAWMGCRKLTEGEKQSLSQPCKLYCNLYQIVSNQISTSNYFTTEVVYAVAFNIWLLLVDSSTSE